MNSASEIFQKLINEQICDIHGALNISDNVIIFGKSQDDHNTALRLQCYDFEVQHTKGNEKLQITCQGIPA